MQVPDLVATVTDATYLVFVLPHQFLPRLLPPIRAALDARGAGAPPVRAISLIKGIDVDGSGLVLISDLIRRGLGPAVGVSVLMGANVANEVAEEQFCEATIGYPAGEAAAGAAWARLFQTPYFRIETTDDCCTVELCGALKNAVALGAGFSDGLGLGTNSKSAILRIGILEMRAFCLQFYGDRGAGARFETFLASCGMADLITTSFSGRNRKCAEAFVRTGRSWDEIEKELLDGQKLQGTLTLEEMLKLIAATASQAKYPLFTVLGKIMHKEQPASALVKMFAGPEGGAGGAV